MSAIETLNRWAQIKAAHQEAVEREVSSLDAAIALMDKHGESTLNDAIAAEVGQRTREDIRATN